MIDKPKALPRTPKQINRTHILLTHCFVFEKGTSPFERSICVYAKDLTRRKFAYQATDPGPRRDRTARTPDAPATFCSQSLARMFQRKSRMPSANLKIRLTDKQIGGDEKLRKFFPRRKRAVCPGFLSWAVENGAVEGIRSGTTLTFRTNPVGFLQAVSQKNYLPNLISGFGNVPRQSFQPRFDGQVDSLTSGRRDVSLGFSFDITRGVKTPTFIGSKEKLTALSVRNQSPNTRDRLHPRHEKQWLEFAQAAGAKYHRAFLKVWEGLISDETQEFKSPELQGWDQMS